MHISSANGPGPGLGYPVLHGAGRFAALPELLPVRRQGLAVISEECVFRHWGGELLEALAGLPDPPLVLVDAATDRLCLAAARAVLTRHGLPGAAYGNLDGAGYLWGGADAVAGRANDTTVARALAYRIPLHLLAPADDRQRGIVAALEVLVAGSAVATPADLRDRLAAGPGWSTPLDAAAVDLVAGDGVPARIAEAITQLIAGA